MCHVGFFSESISLQLAKAPELWVGKVVIRRTSHLLRHVYKVKVKRGLSILYQDATEETIE